MTSQANREQQYRDQRDAVTDDRGNWQFDENGYLPVQPGRRIGLEAQYETNRFVAARNRAARESAIGSMEKGLGLLQSYRPGGQAALASGMFQGLANFHLANQIEAPDQLVLWRDHLRKRANEKARKARELQMGAAVIAGVATMGVGLAAGAGLGVAAMGGLGATASGLGAAAGGQGGAMQGGGAGMAGAMMGYGLGQQQQAAAKGAQSGGGGLMMSQDKAMPVASASGQAGQAGQLMPGEQGMAQGGAGQKQLARGAGAQQGAAPGTQVAGGGAQTSQQPQPMGGGMGGGMGGDPVAEFAPVAPSQPVSAEGLPMTDALYTAMADTAPESSFWWARRLQAQDAFFAQLYQIAMS